MTTKKQFILIIALLALVSMMIVPVCAETLTGTLGESITVYDNYIVGKESSTTDILKKMYASNIEYTNGLDTIVIVSNSSIGEKFTFTNPTIYETYT